MHDDLIERRLRAVLHDEVAGQPFMITAAELERRAVLRGRGTPSRLALLLAAAVAIGALGIAGVIGGAFDPLLQTSVLPTQPSESVDPPEPSATFPRIGPAPMLLPDLDQMLEGVAPESVVVAHQNGSADGSASLPASVEGRALHVSLGTLEADTEYEIRSACISSYALDFELRDERTGYTQGGECGGTAQPVIAVAASRLPRTLTMRTHAPASWRVVVVRMTGHPLPPLPEPPVLQPLDGEERLLSSEFETPAEDGSTGPLHGGLALNSLDSLPPRNTYRVQLWCDGGTALRYLHASQASGELNVRAATQVPCDGRVHSIALGFPEIDGTDTYLAATPGSRVAVLVTSAKPPISLVREEPGWTLSSGFGPAFSFEAEEHSFSGPADQNGPGPARVALACAGPGTIELEVELHAPMGDGEPDETFSAECGAGPSITSVTFDDAEEYLTVSWTSAPEQWTALSILSRDP